MTCKDCIHYEICSLWATEDLDDDKAYEYYYGCFKNKEDFKEVVHGEWKETMYFDEHFGRSYECSNCGKEIIGTSNYCPNCGTKMDKEN